MTNFASDLGNILFNSKKYKIMLDALCYLGIITLVFVVFIIAIAMTED